MIHAYRSSGVSWCGEQPPGDPVTQALYSDLCKQCLWLFQRHCTVLQVELNLDHVLKREAWEAWWSTPNQYLKFGWSPRELLDAGYFSYLTTLTRKYLDTGFS